MGVQATGPGQGLWGPSQVGLSGPFFWPVGWMTCPRRKQGFHGRRPVEVICRWLLWGGSLGEAGWRPQAGSVLGKQDGVKWPQALRCASVAEAGMVEPLDCIPPCTPVPPAPSLQPTGTRL